MFNKKIEKQNFILWFPFVFVGVSFFIKYVAWDIYRIQFAEDGVIEYLQFALYCISFLLAIFSFVRSFRYRVVYVTIMYLIFSLGLFFVAMEEISWGQRIFGFSTPESIQQKNVQGEITLHNIDVFHNNFLHNAYILVSLFALLWMYNVDRFRNWFGKTFVEFFVPPKSLVLYFAFLGLFYAYLEYFVPLERQIIQSDNTFLYAGDQEVFETLLAFAVFGYLCSKLNKLKSLTLHWVASK